MSSRRQGDRIQASPLPLANPAREFKLQEICTCLGVDYDGARYALAQGILPKGIDPEPGRGRHRVFTQSQAVYLAVALKLKEVGITLPRIREIVPWTRKIQEWSSNAGFEWRFALFTGGLQTQYLWFLEFGDGRFVRLRTNAVPSNPGLEAAPWVEISSRRNAPDAKPSVVVTIDIGEIARLLDAASAPSHPVAG